MQHLSSAWRCLIIILALPLLFSSVGCEKMKWGHIGYNTGFKPDQPIPYSHELHAGTYQIPCLYCHTNVEKSTHASVPSLNICMNCHTVVATNKPAIQQLTEKFYAGETVNWVKVHMLPDHVKFNHKRHVKHLAEAENRQESCKTCHGDVKTMPVVEQIESLSMGWCVNCHRKPENNAPLNCSTCHN